MRVIQFRFGKEALGGPSPNGLSKLVPSAWNCLKLLSKGDFAVPWTSIARD